MAFEEKGDRLRRAKGERRKAKLKFMQQEQYLYSFTYHDTEKELCKLESKYIFNKEDEEKLLFSNLKIEPSSSAFIKSRLELIVSSQDYPTLINRIKAENIIVDDFKIEYLVFDGDETPYDGRLDKLRDIGYSIHGNPDYYKPQIIYALCCFEETWFFGILNKDKFAWRKHDKKPSSYSNSININIAKSLVNLASRGNKENTLIDACCGVGTIMLEACFVGIDIEGCEINHKICKGARTNLSHFNYEAEVHRSDIKDITKKYDAAIIDLPYNVMSSVTESDVLHIIESTTKISDQLVIVSTADISKLIKQVGFEILDHCSVNKKGKSSFARRIWVCGKK